MGCPHKLTCQLFRLCAIDWGGGFWGLYFCFQGGPTNGLIQSQLGRPGPQEARGRQQGGHARDEATQAECEQYFLIAATATVRVQFLTPHPPPPEFSLSFRLTRPVKRSVGRRTARHMLLRPGILFFCVRRLYRSCRPKDTVHFFFSW